jgi:hypothetical protein
LSGHGGGWRMEWKDVMAFRVHSDRVVIIEVPVGFKRTWSLPGGKGKQAALPKPVLDETAPAVGQDCCCDCFSIVV